MNNMPSITEYLIATCSLIIDEFNEQYSNSSELELKKIADNDFNEMDLVVRIGYPFRNLVHYTTSLMRGDKDSEAKGNHDLVIKQKDFVIEVKYLKNWQSSAGSTTSSKKWSEFQKDFDWLFDAIDKGNKNKRAFIIGWFNCVDCIARCIQLGEGGGSHPVVKEEKLAYFPFLRKMSVPTKTKDLQYDYQLAYETQRVNLIGRTGTDYQCLFIGKPNDKFHFAIYF